MGNVEIDGIDYDDRDLDTRAMWPRTSDDPWTIWNAGDKLGDWVVGALLALVARGLWQVMRALRRLWRVSPPPAVVVAGGVIVAIVALTSGIH